MMLNDYLERKKEISSREGHVFERFKCGAGSGDFIGNYAKHDLDSIIYAYSVGFKKLYEKYLERIVRSLNQGIIMGEDFGEFDYHQYELTSSLAIANWIYIGINDVELWKNTLEWQDRLYGNKDYSKDMGRVEQEIFTLQILHYIQAQEYEKAIQFYKSVKGDTPLKLNNRISGDCVAYAYCLHFQKNQFTVDQLENASRTFLEKQLVMLYIKGRPQEMLYWLKMVCDAREKEYTPEEVIYTFYEYIPEEEKPDFIKELLNSKEKKSFFSIFKW